MTTITNTDIQTVSTTIAYADIGRRATKLEEGIQAPKDTLIIEIWDKLFTDLIGQRPTHCLLMSSSGTSNNPFFHEACVYVAKYDELYITSNLLQATKSSKFPTILISRLKLHRSVGPDGYTNIEKVDWNKMRPPTGIEMPNGGVNYTDDSIIFCAQGSATTGTGGIWHMPRGGEPKPLVTNFHGRDFNSPNDVVVAKDGTIWFTDPCYGNEQDFRHSPKLPNHVYRFDRKTGDLRVMADGFGRPNGICFNPDEQIVYITDTDSIHGDGTKDLTRPATIYAYDVADYSGAPFLINRRVFAYASEGYPDGIKCDVHGNVYSGCGDGVEVWNAGGTLIGKILVPGGVANFCFGRDGEMFLCGEQNLWRLQINTSTKGALLRI